jgi:hypothetical protein
MFSEIRAASQSHGAIRADQHQVNEYDTWLVRDEENFIDRARSDA